MRSVPAVWRWGGVAAAFFAATAAPAAHAACDDLLPTVIGPAPVKRPITATDLVRLRDIGFPDASVADAPTPLAVSPDGRRVAFVITRAVPAANSYCRGLVVLDLAGGIPKLIDRGGEVAPQSAEVRGLFANYGTPVVTTPAWSPDGTWIAYLKTVGGVTQVWKVASDGSGARAMTRSPVDVESVRWSADGGVLIYTARPAVSAAREAAAEEARSGWLYDDRFTPNAGARPQLRARDVPLTTLAIDADTGAPRDATTTAPPAAATFGLEPADDSLLADARFWWRDDRGKHVCGDPACRGAIGGVWGAPGGSALWFLRREGWRNGVSAFYRLDLASGRVRQLFVTSDVVNWCVPARATLVCLRENATTPRRIAVIDPDAAVSRTAFDPNPEFAAIRLGSVRRLRWRTDRGLEAWGDLVLPPDYRRGARLPMIVVQYHSRGFLRGGTGDEYPIYLFAASGFAVLSFERPPGVVANMPGITTIAKLDAAMWKDWAERRSVQSALANGVAAAVATGVVDPDRVGITGLSDGATSTRFALINSRLFAAAAISTCCVEPFTSMTIGGIAFADSNRAIGYPAMTEPADPFWTPASLARNARRIDTPLLMQLSDDEYLLALEAFTALREQNKPVEMYVFPNEHHNKSQPAHRLAIYERNVDWFAFWLQGREDPDPLKRERYRRWEMMRTRKASRAAR